jgi:hypothetical protein
MNRKLQFALIVLAFGAWNVASAQSTAPAKSVAKPVVAQAGTSAPGMTVAQAPAAAGGQALGAEAAGLELGAGAMTATSGAALGTVTVLGGVAQSASSATTTATHH